MLCHCVVSGSVITVSTSVDIQWTRLFLHCFLNWLVLQAVTGTLDGILDTVSAKHDLALYLALLKVNGVIVMLGVPDEPLDLPLFNIIMRTCQWPLPLLCAVIADMSAALSLYMSWPVDSWVRLILLRCISRVWVVERALCVDCSCHAH